MKRTTLFICLFLIALTAANLIVKHFGAQGLWLSSFLLIPFDFILRCIFHETWRGYRLVMNLLLLTICAAIITIVVNAHAIFIAGASVGGFIAAQIGAGIFYQLSLKKRRGLFFKVNVSDIIAICFDSLIFQFIAFASFDWQVTTGQIIVKALGGLMWYFIFFRWLKIQNKIIYGTETKKQN